MCVCLCPCQRRGSFRQSMKWLFFLRITRIWFGIEHETTSTAGCATLSEHTCNCWLWIELKRLFFFHLIFLLPWNVNPEKDLRSVWTMTWWCCFVFFPPVQSKVLLSGKGNRCCCQAPVCILLSSVKWSCVFFLFVLFFLMVRLSQWSLCLSLTFCSVAFIVTNLIMRSRSMYSACGFNHLFQTSESGDLTYFNYIKYAHLIYTMLIKAKYFYEVIISTPNRRITTEFNTYQRFYSLSPSLSRSPVKHYIH